MPGSYPIVKKSVSKDEAQDSDFKSSQAILTGKQDSEIHEETMNFLQASITGPPALPRTTSGLRSDRGEMHIRCLHGETDIGLSLVPCTRGAGLGLTFNILPVADYKSYFLSSFSFFVSLHYSVHQKATTSSRQSAAYQHAFHWNNYI